jgi:hypothetical protein
MQPEKSGEDSGIWGYYISITVLSALVLIIDAVKQK